MKEVQITDPTTVIYISIKQDNYLCLSDKM